MSLEMQNTSDVRTGGQEAAWCYSRDVPDSGNAKAAFTDRKASKAVCLYQLGGSTSEWFIVMLMEVCVMRAIRTTSGGVCGDRVGVLLYAGCL